MAAFEMSNPLVSPAFTCGFKSCDVEGNLPATVRAALKDLLRKMWCPGALHDWIRRTAVGELPWRVGYSVGTFDGFHPTPKRTFVGIAAVTND